ncbi:D-isomer specific 2-hydroxyacid dehydrogenase family protein [Corynebacterium mayonis]|uniref:D-isomer specific 2-hydroxyacid dehydrogenase family protein n=1 Tax=Corynebacterium mayonis TaxID=3062461 RepID=UPI003140A999
MRFAFLPKSWDRVAADLEAAGHTHVDFAEDPELVLFLGEADDFPEELPQSVKVVQICYAGVEALAKRGILAKHDVRWANAAGLYDDTVAESALALLLAVLHQHRAVSREWNQRELNRTTEFLFDNKKLAILGAGGIGRKLIEFLSPFGVDVTAVNRSGKQVEGARRTVAFDSADMDGIWEEHDYFVAIAPLTEKTHHMINAENLARMKKNAVVINVGRGPLVDHDALAAALADGTIAGAGLDVTEPEPLPSDHRLWDATNCVITPHTANTTHYMKLRVGHLARQNWEDFTQGKRMRTQVDVEQGY